MKRVPRLQFTLMMMSLGIALTTSCRVTDQVYLRGRLINGVTGQPVTNYSGTVELAGSTLNATIKNGEYTLGPVPAYQDFVVRFTAEGYRPFFTIIKANISATVGNGARDLTAYREAYVYPTDVQAPATTVRIFLSNSQAAAGGYVRLRPTNGGIGAFDLGKTPDTGGIDLPAPIGDGDGVKAVPALTNQADAHSALVSKQFSGGVATFEVGELVYGVTYAVDVFGVAGYNKNSATAITLIAGRDDSVFVKLDPVVSASELTVVYLNTQNDTITPNGSLVIGFSEPIEFDPRNPKAAYEEILDAQIGVEITPTSTRIPATCNVQTPAPPPPAGCNPDGDTQDTVLVPNDTANNHGVSITIDPSGLTMTIAWTEASAFMPNRRDTAGEVLTGVIWRELDQVLIRRQDRATGTGAGITPVTLNSLLPVGTSTITVRTAADPVQTP